MIRQIRDKYCDDLWPSRSARSAACPSTAASTPRPLLHSFLTHVDGHVPDKRTCPTKQGKESETFGRYQQNDCQQHCMDLGSHDQVEEETSEGCPGQHGRGCLAATETA